MCLPCCISKPKSKPVDSEIVRTTPLTPELAEKARAQRESKQKIERVVNGLREGQVFPREARK
jgi:hypothetical protein